MTALLIGYARVSTDAQDLTAQREGLLALGVDPGRIYVDHGLTGTNRERPGLREALAACREGDTLVVTNLDRLVQREYRQVSFAAGDLRVVPRVNPLRRLSRRPAQPAAGIAGGSPCGNFGVEPANRPSPRGLQRQAAEYARPG
jgi:hypothetical protein